MKKFNAGALIGIAGFVLSLAGTILSGISSKNEMKATVAKEVAKAISESTTKES